MTSRWTPPREPALRSAHGRRAAAGHGPGGTRRPPRPGKGVLPVWQRSGHWPHIWRCVGQYANLSIFAVDSNEQLHQILWGLPLFPYMTITVTPLAAHPSDIAQDPAQDGTAQDPAQDGTTAADASSD